MKDSFHLMTAATVFLTNDCNYASFVSNHTTLAGRTRIFMLVIARKMNELSFGKLMEVYVDGNRENGQDCWPNESVDRQIALAELDFYDYLNQTFFKIPGAYCAVWQVGGRYVCSLRMEPYQDGLLLEALETAPDFRRKGYAKCLIQEVFKHIGRGKVYSHIHRNNLPSLRTHEACGFTKILDHAVYADGSVLSSSITMMIEL